MELWARVGVDYIAGRTAFLTDLETAERSMGTRSQIPGELDSEQCASALVEGFTQLVPSGDYADILHVQCFRVYNVFREPKAHEKDLRAIPGFSGIKPDPQKRQPFGQQK